MLTMSTKTTRSIYKVNQVDKVHAFDNAAIGDIQARNNTGFQHSTVFRIRSTDLGGRCLPGNAA